MGRKISVVRPIPWKPCGSTPTTVSAPVVGFDLPAHYARVTAVPALPEIPGKDGDRVRIGHLLLRGEGAAQRGVHPEDAEVILGDYLAVHPLGLDHPR